MSWNCEFTLAIKVEWRAILEVQLLAEGAPISGNARAILDLSGEFGGTLP
jgi:hypothetical protein